MGKYLVDIFRKNRRNTRARFADTRSWRRVRRYRLGIGLMRKNVKKITLMPMERSGEHPALQLAKLPKGKASEPAKKSESDLKAGFYILPR